MKRDRTKTAAFLTVALLGLAGVAGCSPTAAYKPATEQGPAQNAPTPVLSEEVKEFSEEGLIAFAEFWHGTVNYALETGDIRPMRYTSADGCQPCRSLSQIPYLVYMEDGWVEGGLQTVQSVTTSFESDASGRYQAEVMVEGSEMNVYRANNDLVKTYKGSPPDSYTLWLIYVDDMWRVADF